MSEFDLSHVEISPQWFGEVAGANPLIPPVPFFAGWFCKFARKANSCLGRKACLQNFADTQRRLLQRFRGNVTRRPSTRLFKG
ncbi:hypothetical protein AB9K41_24480, partial [Cribrihabitans sp. XS_ASV171]